ncbi:MAG: MFS transporter [Dehalococcoidia bacterium]|nr:MAG: MFS transporter [Dehalococcoidia bacterium]
MALPASPAADPIERPARLPLPTQLLGRSFYYGWYIVGVAFVSSMMSMGITAYSMGVFLKPMTQELGWSRTDISLGQTLTTFVTGILGVAIGRRMDARGGRALMVGGAIIGGFGFIMLGHVHELWQYYLVRAGLVAVGSIGMGNLVVNVALSNWFVRRRGRAIAIGVMGTSVAALLLPTVADRMIDAWGWRNAWLAIGVAVWCTVIPAALLAMRRRPEDFGLRPDGDAAPLAGARVSARVASDVRWTRQAAARTPTLWMLVATFGLASTGMGALLLHLIPYMTDAGFTRGEAAGAFGMIGVSGLLSKPLWGIALDRFPIRRCAAAEFLLMGLGITLILASHTLAPLYASIFTMGIGIGGVVTVQEVVWADFFGRLSLGTVRSLAQPFTIVSSAGGPVFAGFAYDHFGSYTSAFHLFIGTYIAAAALIMLTPTPKRPVQPDEALTATR